MNISTYIDKIELYYINKGVDFHALCLSSNTAKLVEKIKYFKNDTNLIISDMGDVLFNLFSLLKAFNFEHDNNPLDLDGYKKDINTLSKFVISEDNLLINYMLEVGIISNIISEHLKYDVKDYDAVDNKRLKQSIYSYILQLFILVNRMNLSVDRVFSLSISRQRAKSKELNVREIDIEIEENKEGES